MDPFDSFDTHMIDYSSKEEPVDLGATGFGSVASKPGTYNVGYFKDNIIHSSADGSIRIWNIKSRKNTDLWKADYSIIQHEPLWTSYKNYVFVPFNLNSGGSRLEIYKINDDGTVCTSCTQIINLVKKSYGVHLFKDLKKAILFNESGLDQYYTILDLNDMDNVHMDPKSYLLSLKGQLPNEGNAYSITSGNYQYVAGVNNILNIYEFNPGKKCVNFMVATATSSNSACSQVSFTWTHVTNATIYRVLDYNQNVLATTTVGTTPQSTYTKTVSGLPAGLLGFYVSAEDKDGNISISSKIDVRVGLCPAKITSVDSNLCGQAIVNWSPTNSPKNYSVTAISSNVAVVNSSLLSSSTLVNTFNNLDAGKTYSFNVNAIDDIGNSTSSSNVVSKLISNNMCTPTGLFAANSCVSHSQEKVVVSWNSVPGATSYSVSDDIGSTANSLTTLSKYFTYATSSELVPHSYVLIAKDNLGNSTTISTSTLVGKCLKQSCSGTYPENSTQGPDTYDTGTGTWHWDSVLGACGWKCNTGFQKVGNDCKSDQVKNQ
jgi:hypothetical protein